MYKLSKLTGIPYTTINDLCNGKSLFKNICLEHALKISYVLNIDVNKLVEFSVLACEDEALQVGILFLLFESYFVGFNLLLSERLHSSSSLCKLVVGSNLVSCVRFLGEITRIANSTCVERFLFLGEIGVAVLTDFAPIVIHHVNRLVLCHVVRAILVIASKLHFEDSYSDALTLRSAKKVFTSRWGEPSKLEEGLKLNICVPYAQGTPIAGLL